MNCRILIVCLLCLSSAAAASELTGQASVVDGDTIEIHGNRIRLWGIDAPESSQLCRGDDSLLYRCGAKASLELDAFLARRPIRCLATSTDQYGRTVATCSLNGTDLGEWLVSHGYALDWPLFSHSKYREAQRGAEKAERGTWSGSFVEPWLYRRCIADNRSISACSDEAVPRPVALEEKHRF
jgi:endonuclease YncB( thermonuclease family)